MAEIMRMPKMSDTMVEGVIATWLKKVGDTIKDGDILAEVETDKATMELEAYESGTLLYIGPKEKEAVAVDSVLAIIGSPEEDIQDLLAKIAQEVVGGTIESAALPVEKAEPVPEVMSEVVSSSDLSRRHFISPLAKKMAKDRNYDVTHVEGTGPQGRIVKRDVEKLERKNVNVLGASSADGARTEDRTLVPVTPMRKTIAHRLTKSHIDIPHFYLTIAVNMDQVVAARTALNRYSSVKITFNDLVIKAVAVALRKHPGINAAWLEDAIGYYHHIHIGVAMAVEDGLLVPIVRFADDKTLGQIAEAVQVLSKKAQEKTLKPEDWTGSTFTLSNLGMFGIEVFSAIINPPAACILAVGAIQKVPLVKEDQLVIGHQMKLQLSCDHRVVDGAVGAAFLNTLKTLLEEPLNLLV